MQESFMPPEDYYALLASRLSAEAKEAYEGCVQGRTETAYAGRHFVIYKMQSRVPVELDRIVVNDFEAISDGGATAEVTSTSTGRNIVIGYGPTQILNHPIFVSLPMHLKTRWAVKPSRPNTGSLSFPLYIQTHGHGSLRESGVTYMVTGPVFGEEFGNVDS